MTLPPHAQNPGSEMTLFSNDEFELHITPHDTDGLRVQAPGLARALGYHSAKDLLRSIPDDEKGWALAPTLGGDQRVSYVTHTGLNRAIGQRQVARITSESVRKQVARFQKWVFGDVLPRLQRGETVGPTRTPALPTARELAQLVIAAEDRADAEAARRAVAEQRIEELEPKADAHDAMLDAEGTLSIGAVANMYGLGRQKLFDLLRDEKILQKDRRPYQEYADWFRVTTDYYTTSDERRHAYFVTRAYMAGALRLHALLAKRGHDLRRPQIDQQLRLIEGGA